MADNVGAIKHGCEAAQTVSRRFLGAFSTEANLTALPLTHRGDGGVAVVVAGPQWWQYDIDSELSAGASVLEPDDGVGRWIAFGGTSGASLTARLATAAAMAASTRTANVRTADANGAMATVDGSAPAVGDVILDKDNATGADRGLWIVDSLGGGAAKWQMTRATGMDSSDDCVPGALISVAEGTANAEKVFILSTNAAITLNTTTLTFVAMETGILASNIPIVDAGVIITATEVEGALQENRTAIDTLEALTMTAGAGLTGGGDLTASRTFDVVANADGSITVNANDIQVGVIDATQHGTLAGGTTHADAIAAGAAGFMTGADKTKIDGIAAGAEVNTVDSVFSRTGAVAATASDYDASEVDNDSTVAGAFVDDALNTLDGEIDTICPGVPMMNRVRMLGAPGAIVAGDTVTIGGDIYEFNAATPPAAGTAGSIWVYQGANSAASRANLINAINNVTDAPNITYDGAVTESMYALAGVTTGDVVVLSATAIGSTTAAPSVTATACSSSLTTGTDIWDAANMYGGKAEAALSLGMASVTVGANHLAKGDIQAYFDFTPLHAWANDRTQGYHDEAVTISGDGVSVALTGGAGPNIQSGDVVDIFAIG